VYRVYKGEIKYETFFLSIFFTDISYSESRINLSRTILEPVVSEIQVL